MNGMRNAGRVLALLVGVASVALLGAAPAMASAGTMSAASAQSDVTQTFRNQEYGAYLSSQSSVCFEGICPNLSWKVNYWNVHVWGDGTRRLQNLYNLHCLRSSGSSIWEDATCDSSTNESWWVKKWNDGTIRFQNQATGLCMRGTSDYGVVMAACDSSTQESWY